MGYVDEAGPEGAPEFNNSPQTVADLTRLRNLAIERGNLFKGTTSQRAAWASDGFAAEGHVWVDTTLDSLYLYAGGGWVLLVRPGGMYVVPPDSVTGSGASIGAAGQVVLSGVPASTTIQIRGIFSSLFRHYRIYTRASSKIATGYVLSGLIGSSAVAGTSYSWTRSGMIAGVTIAANQAIVLGNFGDPVFGDAGTISSSVMDIFSPNAAEPTQIISHLDYLGGSTGIVTFGANLNSSDQLTGLQIVTPAGGTTSAEIRIFGIA
jgi:hypothetical protein